MAKAYTYYTSVRNGDRSQGNDRPGEVVSYQLTAEELAKYGPPAVAKRGGGGDNMAIKITEREAINMRDTADRLAPVTQPAAKAAIINQDFEAAAIQEMEKQPKPEPVKTKRCTKCGKDKPTDQYRKGHGACRACEVADSQRRYAAKKAAKAAATMPAIAGDIASAIPAPAADPVNHPPHYTAGKVECIDALEAAVEGLHGIDAVLTASVIKYMWRWRRKGGLEDLRKAEWYLRRLIGREEA